jgi:hypothetical protein
MKTKLASLAGVCTPKDIAIQTPIPETPYSQRGADLGAEPFVLTRAHSQF